MSSERRIVNLVGLQIISRHVHGAVSPVEPGTKPGTKPRNKLPRLHCDDTSKYEM